MSEDGSHATTDVERDGYQPQWVVRHSRDSHDN